MATILQRLFKTTGNELRAKAPKVIGSESKRPEDLAIAAAIFKQEKQATEKFTNSVEELEALTKALNVARKIANNMTDFSSIVSAANGVTGTAPKEIAFAKKKIQEGKAEKFEAEYVKQQLKNLKSRGTKR